MSYRRSILAFVLASAAAMTAGLARAQCPPDCPVKGGGDTNTDCYAELASDALHLNSPFHNPANPKPAKTIRCFDGDPGCDLDGVVNNSCTFDVDLCLRNADPSLASCTPGDVSAVTVVGKGLDSLQTAVSALLPATTNVCTTNQSVVVPLKGPSGTGAFKAAKLSFKVTAISGTSEDDDSFSFVCVPRDWPVHSYDRTNTRANPLETAITKANVATLVQKWSFVPPTLGSGEQPHGKTISSTVTVGDKLVYTSSWNGHVYALSKKTGKVKWDFATPNGAAQDPGLGVQSSVTILADGRVLVGDSLGFVYCLDGKKGTLLWTADAGVDDPAASHAWASPVVVGNRVLVGIASHNDAPCVRGTLLAYDLDTGTKLWQQFTMPERICFNDTGNECAANSDCTAPGSPCLLGTCDSQPQHACMTNADCPFTFLKPGECVDPPPATTGQCWLERSITCTSNADCPACVPAVGGGVTATASVSPDGKDVYMSSVGCLSRPSVGDSDSIFKLDAATGAVEWVYRTEGIEQFTFWPGGPTYHDYGFLNGPILADVTEGMGTHAVAVGGGKDGTMYAVDQQTGALVWHNTMASPPPFAGFGLFDGALAYDKTTDRFLAALDDISTYSGTDHMFGFTGADGTIAWSDEIGQSWSSVTVANGMVFAGTLSASVLYAYDIQSGARLATLTVPAGTVMGGAAIDNGVIYVPYGDPFSSNLAHGGVVAYGLPPAP